MDAFRTRDALAAGSTRGELNSRRYHRPFHGVRTRTHPITHADLCRAAAVLLPPGAVFSHRSAASLHGIPLPRHAEPLQVDVSVFHPERPPRVHGICGHQLLPNDQRIVTLDGLRVLAPEEVWLQLGPLLAPAELTVAGDYLVTGDEPYSGKAPPASRELLEDALRRHGSRRGSRRLRQAIARIRYGSLSPQETRLRLALEDARLPSPELNYRVLDDSHRVVAMIDLAYPGHRVAIEYLWDHHRATAQAYRDDIRRRELLVHRGWDVIFVTADDAFPEVAVRVGAALSRSRT